MRRRLRLSWQARGSTASFRGGSFPSCQDMPRCIRQVRIECLWLSRRHLRHHHQLQTPSWRCWSHHVSTGTSSAAREPAKRHLSESEPEPLSRRALLPCFSALPNPSLHKPLAAPTSLPQTRRTCSCALLLYFLLFMLRDSQPHCQSHDLHRPIVAADPLHYLAWPGLSLLHGSSLPNITDTSLYTP